MKNLPEYLAGFVIGFITAFILLIGHMLRHDELYHTSGSKFTTNGVMPIIYKLDK